MRIADVRLYMPQSSAAFDAAGKSGDIGNRGWVSQMRVANPMSIYPAYAGERRSWMGPGQEHYAIEIETECGKVGVCANYYGGTLACDIIARHFRRFLIGADPFNTELLWQQMYRASLPYGLGGLTGMAIAGVDLALWDLKGVALGQPVYRLIGGATKPGGIPCYVTVHPDLAGHWRDSGFLGVKVAAPQGAEGGLAAIEAVSELVHGLRATIGPRMELMIDCYMSWTLEFAGRLAARIAGCDVKWFEDPLPSGWTAAQYAELRRHIAPILAANGNLEFDFKAFHALIEAGGTDIIQPELHWCGGLTPALWIAAFARPRQIPIIPHGPNVYPHHLVMATTHAPYAEFVAGGDGTAVRPMFDLLLDQPMPVDGRMHLPDRPGFGVRLNHARLKPYGSTLASQQTSAGQAT